MEITADISKYLEHEFFLGVEDSKMINAAVIWSKEKNNKHVSNIVKFYESMEKFNPTGDLYEMSIPRLLTAYFEDYGFNRELDEIQKLDNESVYIYPMEYFYPLSYDYQHNKFTEKSCMIHHFDATWISKMEKFKTNMKRKNMKWVVYIIDLCIAIKNKIKFFSNYRDITIFIAMFFTLLLCMFTFSPLDENSTSAFNVLNIGRTKTILQILATSVVWTFFCAKVRNIHLNQYVDNMTNNHSDNEEYKEIKLNLEQTLNFHRKEKTFYTIQIIVTTIVLMFSVFEILTIIPQSSTLYLMLYMANMYYLYVGIKKKFKYRILELVPYGIVLASMVVIKPATGMLTSILTFIFVMYEITKNKVKEKRKKSFAISYVFMLIIALILNFSIPNMNRFKEFNFNTSFKKGNIVTNYENYEIDEEITKFEAGKDVFGKNFEKTVRNNVLFSPELYFILSIFVILIISMITKKYEFLYFAALTFLNTVFLTNVELLSSVYLIVLNLFVLILFLIESLLAKEFNK